MASVKSEDIPQVSQFMRELWPLMKATWETEDPESYWTELIDKADALIEKYEDIPIAKKFVVAYLEHQDAAWHEKERKHGSAQS